MILRAPNPNAELHSRHANGNMFMDCEKPCQCYLSNPIDELTCSLEFHFFAPVDWGILDLKSAILEAEDAGVDEEEMMEARPIRFWTHWTHWTCISTKKQNSWCVWTGTFKYTLNSILFRYPCHRGQGVHVGHGSTPYAMSNEMCFK